MFNLIKPIPQLFELVFRMANTLHIIRMILSENLCPGGDINRITMCKIIRFQHVDQKVNRCSMGKAIRAKHLVQCKSIPIEHCIYLFSSRSLKVINY